MNNHNDRQTSIRARHVAIISGAVFDIPPRARTVLTIIGIIGAGLILMESLVVRQEQTIEFDKIIHFTGYGMLACVIALILKPRMFVVGAIGLVLFGGAIEIFQGLTMRAAEWGDFYANTLGVIFGGGLGIGLRYGYATISKDLAEQKVRRNLRRYQKGETIVREGEHLQELLLIKSITKTFPCFFNLFVDLTFNLGQVVF